LRSSEEVDRVLGLLAQGRSRREIARETGIPRATIVKWAIDGAPTRWRRRHLGTCLRCAGYRNPLPGVTDHAYAYLLGLYLGDGSIASHPRGVYRLRISLDRRYPMIVAECEAAMSLMMPSSKVSIIRHRDAQLDEVSSFSRHWPCLFPQHGPGLKHNRPIRLEPWQQRITRRHPERLLRGLIHSDGCRATNVIRHPRKTYSYPRYFFSNRSDDIMRIFCNACDQLGIPWRRNSRFEVNVAKRDSVALMDRFVGPKR
jgi:hypothetical protein